MVYDWVHRLRLWLWGRQERMMVRDTRATGTSEGDWIGANVAASAASSGTTGHAVLSQVAPSSAPSQGWSHDGGSSCSVGSDGGSSGGG